MNRFHFSALSAIALFLTTPVAPGQTVIRGPYLQSATPTSMVVRWRTDESVSNSVFYGTSPTNLDQKARSSGASSEHIVLLKDLQPETRYYYGVGTTNQILAGGTAGDFFVTPPVAGTPKPSRVWILGDAGTANANQRAVRDAYYKHAAGRHTDVVLMLGDNAYVDGSDKEYQAAVFDIYGSIIGRSPLWSTLGNHDYRSANSATQSGVYYDIFTFPTLGQAGGLASGTEAYYSFDHANIHFICLDSQDSDRSPGGLMMTWLKNDLAATRQEWIVAFWHHPPYSKGSHDTDNDIDSGGRMREMREIALPILEAGGVDLVFTGHSHSYERSFLIDGHYGKSPTFSQSHIKDRGDGRPDGQGAYKKPTSGPAPHEGAVYVVAGSSGKISRGPLDHPAMFLSLMELGSVVLEVNGSRLDAVFLGTDSVPLDHFTLIKGEATAPAAE